MTTQEFDVDVLVVGLGPAGASLSLALAREGVKTRAITRYPWLSNSPRAHITNQRAGEVFRDLGVMPEIERRASPWEHMGDQLFTTSLAGPEIARLRAWGTGDDQHGAYVRASPVPMVDIAQPLLESVLVEGAALHGTELQFQTDYLSHVEDEDGVTTTLMDRRSGEEYTVRSKYLIGADGARSGVLKNAGLPLEGVMGRAATVYVRFAGDLSRYVAHRPSILHWVWGPSSQYGEIGMGLIRAVKPWTEWIAGWGYDPEAELDLSEDVLIARIQEFVGDTTFVPEILDVSTWQVNQTYATQYSTQRVFCAGDAVHRHPPSGGLGSNTCVQDSFNLAWKLAYVIKGFAGTTLLDSYSEERAPVGRAIVERANRSRTEFGHLTSLLRELGSGEALIDGFFAQTEEAAKVRAAVHQAVQLKNREFNAHGFENNDVYRSTAIIDGGVAATPSDELVALRALEPGRKLPHAWLVDSHGYRVSTLDLVGKGAFSVVTGLSGMNWIAAVAELGYEWLNAVQFGDHSARDAYGEWARTAQLPENAAILVRPDGYVAAIFEPAATSAAATETLTIALRSILGLGESV